MGIVMNCKELNQDTIFNQGQKIVKALRSAETITRLQGVYIFELENKLNYKLSYNRLSCSQNGVELGHTDINSNLHRQILKGL